MAKDKALKRDVRSRMTKTGESYTTARHFLLEEHKTEPVREAEPVVAETDALDDGAPVLPPRITEPGVSDDAILKSTGTIWDEWFVILDAWDATKRTHTEIARYLASEFEITGWWAQNVTVGYERARGLRKVHEHLDGYSVSASRTFGTPVERLYRAFADDAERAEWLEPELINDRTFTEYKVW